MENILSVLVGTVNRFLWGYLLIYALLGISIFLRCILVRRRLPSWARDSNPYSAACLPKVIKTISPYRSFRRWRLLYPRKSVRATSPVWRPPLPQAARVRFFDVAFAVLGMSTIFAEALLAQKYRVVSHGKYIGGRRFILRTV